MKKYITIPVLATVTLLLAIGIVVACTKENTNKTTTIETPGNARKESIEQKLANELFSIWHKSDSAYRANAISFLDACHNEDEESFNTLTNISEQQWETIDSLLIIQALELPALVDPTPCIPCNTSLWQYGKNIASMRDVIDELKIFNDPDTVPCFLPYIDSCINLCMNNLPSNATGMDIANCFLNCTLAKERIRMEKHLVAIKVDD
ncbi:MAG: hypothetical protein J6V98_07995 [Bacteroidales bacterium]|nr:hypothetical protein [Bacteroidales bacterium]